ncbi:MAG TPA: FAD-dependent monooxygenase [Xanthobacteraceae bacterium]|jgi:flavin-dependent dehydrogenase|nr:FAD-dependent monooxygenase [Xanthobacteraceae bacterium]
MVTVDLPDATDVFVIGGGPAGLAAALAARRNGLAVVMADRARPPIDKACGEGVMPDGVAALREMGVELGPEHGLRFRGIRFLDDEHAAEALFPGPPGLGIRRTLLHRLLAEHARSAGVVTAWQTRVDALDPAGVKVGGRTVRCRWIVGADGYHSRVRRSAGLHPAWTGPRRLGLRRHFRIQPWTDFVEVYWHKHCQAYVTPVGADEVCIAIVRSGPEARMSDLPTLFPGLAKRLGRAEPIGCERGAISMSTKLTTVTRGRIALLGDASGSVDAVTGEGLALAFRQAAVLGAALAAGDLAAYEAAHRRLGRLPRLMARTLLLMDRSEGLRKRALRALAARPRTFDRLLGLHVGALRPAEVSLDICDLAFRLLAPGTAAPQRLDAACPERLPPRIG